MDSFGTTPKQAVPIIRDQVITQNTSTSKNNTTGRIGISAPKDSFSISSTEINNIVQSIKANNITDLNSIKDIVTFKDASGFNVNSLSDHQLSKLLSAVKGNITENIASNIHNIKHNDKLVEFTAKEKAQVDNILTKLRSSHITNTNQAIDFIKSQSADNPSLLSKLSGRIATIVNHNNSTKTSNALVKDSFTPAISMEQNKFSNPFKSDSTSRSNQPRTAEDAKNFLRQINSNSGTTQNSNPQSVNNMSNLILSNYLRGNTNPASVAEQITRGKAQQITNVDKMTVNNKVLHENVSFMNDVASKIAAKKARTIIICRLAGEISGAAVGALGMASVAGATPLIGLIGAIVLTMAASIAGLLIGKITGDMVGKLLTDTDFDPTEMEDKLRFEEQVRELEEERERQRRKQQEASHEEEDIEEHDDDEISSNKSDSDSGQSKSNFNEVLKTAALINKKKL